MKIWNKEWRLSGNVFLISKQLPTAERFGLASQITRAAVSIPSNIAEGSSRTTDKEKKRFAEIALGSAFELETQLLTIKEIGLANLEDWDKLMECLHQEQRMINSFINTLKG